MSQKETHVLIVGAGAVGCFYGSRLHEPSRGVHVSLVCRSNYKAIAAGGVQMQTRNFGNYTFTPHRVFSSIDHAAASTDVSSSSSSSSFRWDYIVVTTKALPDIVDDAAQIKPLVANGHSAIVLIQNGVGIERPHRVAYPNNPIISAVTVISAEQIAQGVIRQNRWMRIHLGAFFSDGPNSARPSSELETASQDAVQRLVEMLKTGGVSDASSHSSAELQLIRWHKLTINSAFNPSSVLSGGSTNSAMSLDPELRLHIRGIMLEIWETAPKILGQPFDSHLAMPDKILTSTERNTSGRPSMLVDWENGRPMELEVILGNPIRIAREHGIEMPRMQSLYALLKMAQRRRNEAKKAAQEGGGQGKAKL
ncbi:unnamed protein product [Tilletia laevis]|uniref:2-dehydropantoate 2-reductase n=3 Tax=Tilletia TaxID=13289 RepID=A0A8X7SWS7_9BASI|nr:hypothetical protein CF336_g3707 [Tilletia laevis]KAE8247832.1 hypothetical protein A4X06_0g4158 [Tilletia controversa]KAE8261648.1 hypothetical protein A4X03_0g3078 [Tilletia caries]KAE8203684.1 hypothetical protein CF335_g2924 [Tilletia laevis]CAD6893307.1 unnamed protein product [Tilletia caries]